MATIKKRGDSYYVVYWFEGKHHWKVAGSREIDAKRLKSTIEKAIYGGTHREVENITFQELADKWLEVKQAELRPRTYASYLPCVNRLTSHFGKTKVKKIGTEQVERFAADLLKAEIKTVTKKGTEKVRKISPATASRVLTILKGILAKGVQWGYISRNPAEYVRKPRIEKPEVEFLEPGEIKRLIESTDERHKALIMFACLTGARQSEILGLRWSDLDLEEGKANIRQVLQGGRFLSPKSQASRRTIDLPPVLMRELKTHQLRQAVKLEENPHDLVFTSNKGTPLDSHNVTHRILEPALRIAGIRKVGFHALRHSYVSMLISQGENVKTIQALVGHASARMTWDVYGHLFEGAGKEAANRLQKTLYGDLEKFDANQFANES